MKNSDEPQLPRMPGSAILATVVLGLGAVGGLGGGVFAFALLPSIALLLLVGGALNAVLAVGIVMRRHWARIAGIVLNIIALAFAAFGLLAGAAAGAYAGASGAPLGTSALMLYFLSQQNTRAWCNVGRRSETSFLSIDHLTTESEDSTLDDKVELLEHVYESGLRPGMVGTVVDLPDDPEAVVVEFSDPDDGEAVWATLRLDQIRFLTETETETETE